MNLHSRQIVNVLHICCIRVYVEKKISIFLQPVRVMYLEESFLTHVLTAELGSFESKQVDVVPFDLLSESCRTGSSIEK
jgi:hypothetical protein